MSLLIKEEIEWGTPVPVDAEYLRGLSQPDVVLGSQPAYEFQATSPWAKFYGGVQIREEPSSGLNLNLDNRDQGTMQKW